MKVAYLGKRYNGFEHHTGQITPLPTIEEELWKALNKARLIFPKDTNPLQPGEVNWEGTEYSKCGRTDKGVSAFGQVIGIRVRSNRALPRKKRTDEYGENLRAKSGEDVQETRQKELFTMFPRNSSSCKSFDTLPRENGMETAALPLAPSRGQVKDMPPGTLNVEDEAFSESLTFDPIADEIDYPSLLNRLLPPDIRILAWCPSPPLDFSARFSCRERRYRYFFTQPAFLPSPHVHSQDSTSCNSEKIKDGWLDVDAMREAAHAFEGVHDFRNFCKVDPGKQISNFERRIYHSDIEEVADSAASLAFLNGSAFLPPKGSIHGAPKIYTFTLHGSAFLWHQVRCMVSILFLVGQGLEKPSIVSELLNASKNPQRPTYEMATDTPLVLWDCIFPHEDDPGRNDAMQWVYVGDGVGKGEAKYGIGGLVNELWRVWRERKVDEMLIGSLIDVVTKQGTKTEKLTVGNERGARSQRVFDGGNGPRLQGTYIPVMQKPKMESVDVINEKYAVRKGFESAEEMKELGFRRLNTVSAEQEQGRAGMGIDSK